MILPYSAYDKLNSIDCSKLSLEVDVAKLVEEYESLGAIIYSDHGQIRHEEIVLSSGWSSLSLTSSTGLCNDDHALRSAPIENCNQPTELLRRMPLLMALTKIFSPITRCRLFKLEAGATVPAHIDSNLQDYKLARLVVPIYANDGCITRMNSSAEYTMRPGEIWFLNDGQIHEVLNQSDSERIVAVIQSYNLEIIAKGIIAP